VSHQNANLFTQFFDGKNNNTCPKTNPKKMYLGTYIGRHLHESEQNGPEVGLHVTKLTLRKDVENHVADF
jgi:hypothetical protein